MQSLGSLPEGSRLRRLRRSLENSIAAHLLAPGIDLEPAAWHTALVRLSTYIVTAMSHARYELVGGHTFYGELPACRGVRAKANTLDRCRQVLQQVLEDWIVQKLRNHEFLPAFRGHTLTIWRGKPHTDTSKTAPLRSMSRSIPVHVTNTRDPRRRSRRGPPVER